MVGGTLERMVTLAQILQDECLDRMYVHVYVPDRSVTKQLQFAALNPCDHSVTPH